VPKCLQDFLRVYSEEGTKELPILPEAEHVIDLVPKGKPLYGLMYPISEAQRKELVEYLRENLTISKIRYFKADAGAPVLFILKKDNKLRLYVNYKSLNRVTIKNRYPFPLILKIIDQLKASKVFSKLDLRDTYYRIRIKKGDEWKTAFRTWYGQFEYIIMPFGLINALTTF
jgi:hypothetical protein